MDKNDFFRLYNTSSKELYRYCLSLCGNSHDAHDLMQQTYLRAWENLDKFYDDNFSFWLCSVARNIFLNNLKRNRLEYFAEELPEIPDNSQNPEFIAEKRDIGRILLKALNDSLSPVQRLTVILYYYDEKSVSEIADIMKCSVGTVESRLYYARKKLRKALKNDIFSFGWFAVLSMKRRLKNIKISVNARITASAVLTVTAMTAVSMTNLNNTENKLPQEIIILESTSTQNTESTETASIRPTSHTTTKPVYYTTPTSESLTTAFKSEFEEIAPKEDDTEPEETLTEDYQPQTETEEETTMKKEIISAVTALTTAFSGMTMTAAFAEDTVVNTETTACETTDFQLIKGLPWYYNDITGEISNYSEVIYNHHLDWIKSYDNYYNAEHDVYCKRVDYLAEEINSYLPSESLGAEKVWKISFPTGVTNIYTEERVRDCLRLQLNAQYLTDERKEDGVAIPQEVYDSLFYEFKDYILSEIDDRFAVEYDRYQGYGSSRFDLIYGTGNGSWISLAFKSSDKAENYETACEITQKLVDKYGSEAVSSDLWLDCHGIRCYYFSDNEFESDGFSAIDPQQIERASYSASAPFTKIDVTRGAAYFDVAGFAEKLDLQPITPYIRPDEIKIADNSKSNILGDANLDGRVSISDSVAISQYLANSEKYPLSPQAMANADIFNTGDGVTGSDAAYIQQIETS